MTLRRLPWGLLPAALVGLLVHIAASGFGHVPGLGHAPALLGLLVCGLTLAALTAFLGAALEPGRLPIATKGVDAASLGALALAGFAAYTCLELLEGHGFGSVLPALVASVPFAALVMRAARALASFFAAAGIAFAAFARRSHVATETTFARVLLHGRLDASFTVPRAHRGRAPPLLA
jgi:hypothetical protein